jgi:hypothetical protein
MKSDILRYRIRACIGSSALSFIRALHVSAAYISRSSHTVFLGTSNDSPCERLYFFCMILSQCSVVKLRGPNEEVAFPPSSVIFFRTHIFQLQRLCQRLCQRLQRVINDCVSDSTTALQRLRRDVNDCVNDGQRQQPRVHDDNLYIRVY